MKGLTCLVVVHRWLWKIRKTFKWQRFNEIQVWNCEDLCVRGVSGGGKVAAKFECTRNSRWPFRKMWKT